jgi:hypothetical protein
MRQTAILTLHSSDNARLARLAALNKWDYADRHGYDLIAGREPWPEAAWSCLYVIRDCLRNYRHVLAVGSDVVFANPDISIESRMLPGKALVLAHGGHGGPHGFPINNDVTLWTAGFDAEWLIRWLLKEQDAGHPYYWQGALVHGLQNEPRVKEIVGVREAAAMNSHPRVTPCGDCCPDGPWRYQPGHWICHFLTGSNQQKADAVQRFLDTGDA